MTKKDPLPTWAKVGRSGWQFDGRQRPAFAVQPRVGQESVWDYPRPPALVADSRRVVISADDLVVADTILSRRLLETASPPTFYLPIADIDMSLLRESDRRGSRCEWKGQAQYWDVLLPNGQSLPGLGWSYPKPFADYAALKSYIAFYPTPLVCTVDGQRVVRQPGQFYGGWITDELVGPFKGDPRSGGW